MTKFDRMFPEPWMDCLTHEANKKSGWWRDLLDYRFQDESGATQPLALAVRNGYLNAYAEGQSILKIKFDKAANPTDLRAEIHHKHLGEAVSQEYRVFDGDSVAGAPYLPGKSLHHWVKNAREFAKPKTGSGKYSEKQGVAVVVGRNSHVIDLEMALPGLVAPRIDMVALERSGSAINIMFYEAKLFRNPALRAKNFPPKVLDQLDKYESWLTSGNRIEEVIEAYREACGLLVRLREMQGLIVDELVVEASKAHSDLRVDPRPRLIVFGYDKNKPDLHWPPHEAALRRAGLDQTRLVMELNPKDVRLSRGTLPEGYIDKAEEKLVMEPKPEGVWLSQDTFQEGCDDDAEDILAFIEGQEVVEEMKASIRHNKLFAIARFAPIFTAAGFQFATWYLPSPHEPGGIISNCIYSQEAEKFIKAAYGSGWIIRFKWSEWLRDPEAQKLCKDTARIATANEDQLGRVLTAYIRNDHFNEGGLKAAFENGILTAIVQRAEALLHV